MFKKILPVLILSAAFIYVSFNIYINRDYFTRQYDFMYFANLYSESQYVKGGFSEGGIGDDGLYAFSGYYYLFQGGNPIAVNFEHPPLGKYLIGISVLLFNNENIISIIYLFILSFFTFRLSVALFKDRNRASLAVLLLFLDPLMFDNLKRSLLDLPFSLFITAGFYYFVKNHGLVLNTSLQKNKTNTWRMNTNIILMMFYFGLAFSVRFFPQLFFILLIIYVYSFLWNRKILKNILFASLVIVLVYLCTHAVYFAYAQGVVEFIRHKIWMLSWFKGTVTIPFNLVVNIFTGYYQNPQGITVKNNEWSLILPLSMLLFLLYPFYSGIKRIKKVRHMMNSSVFRKSMLFYFPVLCFLIYSIFFTSGVIKFLMPVMPSIYVFAAYLIWELFDKSSDKIRQVQIWTRKTLKNA